MPPSPLTRIRRLCLKLPESHEVEAWGTPTFRVRNKMFAMYADNHHGDGYLSIWLKSTMDNQEMMIATKPKRFFKPPYMGPSGWVGVRLDGRPNWSEVEELVRDAWRLVAPKRLAATLPE